MTITIRNSKTLTVLFLIIFNYSFFYSQITSDSLISNNYQYLLKNFENFKDDIKSAELYANSFLLKSKKENNELKKVEGYYLFARMLCRIPNYHKALVYLDSSITISKYKKDFYNSTKAHILKANIYGSQSKYKLVMKELAKANGFTNITNNKDQQNEVKYLFSLLYKNLGEYEKSMEILKEVIFYYKKKYKIDKSYEKDFILSLYAYSSGLNYLKKIDSAEIINKKITQLSLKSRDSILYDRILLSSAVTHYLKKEYLSALDSLKKSEKITKNKTVRIGTEVSTNYYYGKIYFEQRKYDLAIDYLEKVDALVFKNNYFPPDLRENYEFLIDFYKEGNDAKKQLFYIDRLLTIDSIMDNDVKYLSLKMNTEYTTPNLILEKQRIINSLQKSNYRILLIFVVLIIIFTFLFFRNYKKQKIYKNRFEEFVKLTTSNNKKTENLSPKSHRKIDSISKEIAKDILLKLDNFENKKGFIKKNITVIGLAKQLDTNSKYLSKVINNYKNKSFTNYINELRILYTVKSLKSTPKLRKYTIKAISSEFGFNSTEAFSKSFYKVTNLYPSYFIKQLGEKEIK